LLLALIVLLGTSAYTVKSLLQSSTTISISGVISAPSGPRYTSNAVWIQDDSWTGFASPYCLTNDLEGVVTTLSQNNIDMAFVFVGFWIAYDPTDPYIDYQHDASFYANVIDAFHAENIQVLAWAESYYGTMDLRAYNRQVIYDRIVECMNIGFDGYNDDVEDWTGTLQDYIDYLNGATTVLHNLGKLMTADVAFDWQINVNPYLYMDYIVTMFYSDWSMFEDPDGPYYFQENFGHSPEEIGGDGSTLPPASPVILGIMNCYVRLNDYPISYQLSQCSNYLAMYEHPQLSGFCIWLYEYMGSYGQTDDWAQWNSWINSVGADG